MQNDNNIETLATPKKQTKFDRLPPNITPETEVRKDILNDKKQVVSFEITTVAKRLNELKARYKKNKLVDAKGREIKFFEPLCRGVSRGIEGDEEDQQQKDKELAELQKNFTVIVLYCDPRKAV
jgi:hypothetical protein